MTHTDSRCPICFEQDFVEIAQEDRYETGLLDSPSAFLCMDCGIIFLNPRLAEDEYNEFYTNRYRELVSLYWGREFTKQEVLHDQGLYSEALDRFFGAIQLGLSNPRILDLGGSCGLVARVLAKRFGGKATVLDPNSGELERASLMGLETIHGTIESETIEGQFNLILLCRTIDHLFNPMKVLKKIHKSLPERGWFYVDIVDWLAVARSEGLVNSLHIDHPFNFTPSMFRQILKSVGFSVVRQHISPSYLGVNSGVIEHGFLCRKAIPGHPDIVDGAEELLCEIRKIQAEERKVEVKRARAKQ